MFWGAGSALGFLALLGYGVFVCGAVLLWLNRLDVPIWVHDEFGAVRRSVIRHAVSFRLHGLREEVACSAKPTGFIRRLARHSRRRINRGTILLTIGLLLFFLDFFV
jgi:hypothetical protein